MIGLIVKLMADDVDAQLLNAIKIIYFNSLACVRVIEGETRLYLSPWLFNVYMEVEMGMSRIEARFLEERENEDYLASFMQMTLF